MMLGLGQTATSSFYGPNSWWGTSPSNTLLWIVGGFIAGYLLWMPEKRKA